MLVSIRDRIVYWLYRRLMNRRHLAPELAPGARCAVPGCYREAAEQWMPSCCALREAGVAVDWVPVCAEHDLEINEHAVRSLYGGKYDAALAAYRSRRLGG